MGISEVVAHETRDYDVYQVNTGCIKIPEGFAIIADTEWIWWVDEHGNDSNGAFFTVWECLADIKREINIRAAN